MSENSFDLIIIGAGPGGYVAAIRAAQLGMNVACVEKRASLGGTCLNVGCIPSKALLNASEHYADAAGGTLAALGVDVGAVKLDLPTMMKGKDTIVTGLTSGIDFLFKKNKITRLQGTARITAPGKYLSAMAMMRVTIQQKKFSSLREATHPACPASPLMKLGSSVQLAV